MANYPSSLIVVDSQVDEYWRLVDHLGRQGTSRVIQANEDGVAVITDVLRQYPTVNTLVVIAHGAPGQMFLGRTSLDLDSLEQYSTTLGQWFGESVTSPQIHLYGCQVAAGDAGSEFLSKLHALTGAGIAASPRWVGHADLGGDWNLDATVGAVTAVNTVDHGFAASYRAVLGSDNFGMTAPLLTAGVTSVGSNVGATHQAGEPIHDPNVAILPQVTQESLNNSIWWQWTATTTGLITVDTLGSSIDTVLAVYTGGAVNSLNQIAFNDNISGSNLQSRTTFTAVMGTTYYFAVDGVGSATGDVRITLNTAPQIAPNQIFSIAENSANGTTVGTVAVNEPVTWSIVSGNPDNDNDGNRAFLINPVTGIITVNDSGDLDFESFATAYNLLVRATDGGGLFDEKFVTINLLDVNEAPVILSLAPTQSSINEGGQITLVGSFRDLDANDLHTVTINWGDGTSDVIGSANLDRDANGNFVFSNLRHIYQDNGTYVITMTVRDAGGLEATPRTTNVVVNNVPPTITQGATLAVTVNEDSPTTFTLNATDPGRQDVLTWNILNQPSNGTATVSGTPGTNQVISYTPNPDFAGTDTFEVQVADGDGGFDTILVTVTVVPQPDPPRGLNIQSEVSTINEGDTFTLTGTFSDPDVGDTFTVTINWGDGTPATVLSNSNIVSLGNGNYRFTTSHTYRVDSGAGSFSISAIVRDSAGLTVSDTLAVTVVNVPPTIVQGSFLPLITNEDTPITFDLSATDPADTNFQWSIVAQPPNGTVTFVTNPNGSANQTLRYTPNANFDQNNEFSIRVSDGNGGVSTITVFVNVVPVNDAPTTLTLTGLPTAPINEGGSVTLGGSFIDVDRIDSHTVTINWGDGTTTTLTAADLTRTPPVTGTTYTLPASTHVYADDGNFTVTVTVTDAAGATTTRTQTVTVNNVAPTILNEAGADPGGLLPTINGLEDTPLTFGLRAFDPGVTDILSWSISSPPSRGTVTILPPVDGEPQQFRYTPNPDVSGPDTFTIRLSDGDGGFDTVVVTVNIVEVNDLPVITTNQFTITEGQPLRLTQANLSATDVETFDPNLLFFIENLAPGNGSTIPAERFEVDGITRNFFTLQEVIEGRVTFVDNGDGVAPAFTIRVQDGNGGTVTVPANVTFIEVNDAPVIVNAGFTVTQGQTVLLTSANFSATDEESDDATLRYDFSRITGGVIRVNGVVSTSFTQADINGGRVSFVHDNSETVPILEYTVSDGLLSTPRTAVVNFINVNDPPRILANRLTLTEGDIVTITLQHIDATDPDNDDNTLVFEVTGLPTDPTAPTYPGTFERFAGGMWIPTTFFTRQDLVDGNVRFNHSGNEVAPAYTLIVRDSGAPVLSDSSAATVNFTAVNDPPIFSRNLLTIAEGATVVLTSTDILATDEETPASGLTFTVSDLVGGRFELVANPGTAITSFTQADINSGRVQFVHDGAERPPTYVLTVSDGVNEVDSEVAVIFTLVNDAPILINNRLTITEGQSRLITTADINASDEEDNDNTLTFTVGRIVGGVFVPDATFAGGRFVFVSAIDVAITSFTRDDIINQRVRFIHDGTETSPNYAIRVTDSGGASTFRNADVTFTPVNDLPVVQRNRLIVEQGGVFVFNRNLADPDLRTTDEETTDPSRIVYTVTAVAGGQFENVSASGVAITEFTQADLDAGNIRFVHDNSETVPSYTLSVSDSTGGVVTSNGNIFYTNINDAPRFLANSFSLIEGGTVVLTTANINAVDPETPAIELRFRIESVVGGFFARASDPTVAITEFTLDDILREDILFVQPPALKEIVPSYTISVIDTDPDPANVNTVTENGTINFTPINDPPEILVNTLTVTEGSTVVFGDGLGTAVTGGVLRATDPETPAAQLIYTVSGVLGGRFELVNGSGVWSPTLTFTQAQITANQVRFVQDGTSVRPSYTVTVRDPEGLTATGTPTVNFTDVNDPPEITRNVLTITEGDTVILSSNNLQYTDEESGPDQVTYTVITVVGGQFERVAAAGTAITSFTQADVNAGAIQFVHDGTETVPSYSLTLRDSGSANGAPITVGPSLVTVNWTRVNDVPEFRVNTLTLNEGDTVILGDTNLLAEDEESGPADLTYQVQSVTNGRFALVSAPTVAITSFTQAQVNAGQVQFVHDGGELAPTYTLVVSDGEGATATIPSSINFTNVNDAPTFLFRNVAITEGATVTLGLNNITATDPDHPDDQILYGVSNVVGGSFFRNGTLLTPWDAANPRDPNATFSAVDLSLGRITFVDNGDNSPPSFSFVAVDPDNAATTVPAIISFTPVNDPPVLRVNQFSITEGQPLVITALNLAAEDEETTNPAQLRYQVRNVVGGSFISLATSNILFSFTQAEVNAGNDIVFIHDGTETVPSFTIEVTDPDGGTTGQIAAIIDYIPVNDAPIFSRNSLTIAEGQTVVLSTTNILVNDVDTPLSLLDFRIDTVQNGFFSRLNTDGTTVQLNAGDTFTRTDLVLGRISFTASDDGSAPAYTLTVRDNDPLGSRETQRVASIAFTPINDLPVITANNFQITEGADLVLTTTNLNATDEETLDRNLLVYTMSGVQGGTFINIGTPTPTNVTTFTQRDVDQGLILFRHNGSETPAAFTIALSDSTGGVTTVPGNVIFTNVNDPPVITANNFPITEGGTLRLTTANLNATDPDNTPAQLVYTVGGLARGQFSRDTDLNGVPDQPGITTFTQQEVLNGAIFFIHDGSENAPTFTLTLSDGQATLPTVPGGIVFTNVNDPPEAVTLALSNTTINEGSGVVLNVTFRDVDSTSHTVTIDWGDGTTTTVPAGQILNEGGGNFRVPTLNRTYPGDGVFTITASVNDGQATTRATAALTVNDVPPIVPLTGSGPIRAGQRYTLNIGTPIDPGNDQYVAFRINWGDGTTTTVNNPGDVTKVYKVFGDYTISVTAIDTNNREFTGFTQTANILFPTTDFSGNGLTDLFWRTGVTNRLWSLNAAGNFGQSQNVQNLDSNFVVQSVADFDNDGKVDVFWRNTTTGEIRLWFMDGTNVTSATTPPAPTAAWRTAGFADFNNDGNIDVLWRNTDGRNSIWTLNNGTRIQGLTLPSQPVGFEVAGLTDVNQDGFDDIIWRNASTGQNLAWIMDGTTFSGRTITLPSASSQWSLVGIADFNNDKIEDFVWRTTTGRTSIWEMGANGTRIRGTGLPDLDPGYQLRGATDLNSDSQPDLLWRNSTTGDTLAWIMNGTAVAGTINYPTLSSDWQVFV
ncbi:hypothetical protein GFS31_36950 [Leptolyngbya sp. BL0902]|uniref:cadherin-like domain-containing protein n=1 Tax=Leptolyngbya sp. BL0902 TaxID=1115757 RepID=UPI0018E8DB91|nr:cadherin-like domain-containing protein [Leptolyngbya sp. BL0902]QQE66990.1 hypothetical protein GFS31_36950 [Leptolyngbya sp. BL0902]